MHKKNTRIKKKIPMSPVPEMCLDFHIHTPELFFLNVMQSLKNIPIILLELEGA